MIKIVKLLQDKQKYSTLNLVHKVKILFGERARFLSHLSTISFWKGKPIMKPNMFYNGARID